MTPQAVPLGFIPDAAPMSSAAPAGFIPDAASAAPGPDFRASSVPAVQTFGDESDANTLGTFARHVGRVINPVTAIKSLGQLWTYPEHAVAQMLHAHGDLIRKAKDAYDQGHTADAAVHLLNAMVPLLGPSMDTAAESVADGKTAAGLGDAVGLGLSIVLPKMAGAAVAGRAGAGVSRAARTALTAEEQAANAFAAERGVPLDAATATGNPFVRGVQKVAGESMLGAPSAGRAQAAQSGALARVGGEIADTVHPAAVTAEDAGAGVTGTIRRTMADLHREATQAYDVVRRAEETARPDTVPLPPAPVDALKGWQRAQLRRVVHELDASGYVAGKLHADELLEGGSGTHYTPRSGGAKVYHDITEALGHDSLTRGEVQEQLEAYLGGGKETAAVKAGLAVARGRFMGSRTLSTPELPASAFEIPTRLEKVRETSAAMPMAVDLTEAKAAVRPIFDRLSQENRVAPLMGGKAEALRALDRVINGPDHVPLTVAEAALGDLKSLARADDPLLRTAGQGVSAKAVSALQEAVELRAAGAGDTVYDALKAGRAATRGKFAAGDVLEQLRDEPVRLFGQLTAPKDAAIDLLRQVQQVAPQSLPAIGRAKLESWLDLATERGRFDHADRLYAEWQKLGPETKRLLFGKADTVAALDKFFLLAKRIGQNPNPSGTAPTLLKATEITGALTHPLASLPASVGLGGIAKLLYAPRGVRALTRLLEADVRGGARSVRAGVGAGLVPIGRAGTAAAWLDLAAAAKAAGVPFQIPKAADRDSR